MFDVLQNSVFRFLFIGQLISLLGTGLATVALALLVYAEFPEYAGFILGAVLSIKMIAYLGVAPVAGAFAHHLPRRLWLSGLNFARALVIIALPFLEQLWQLFTLIFLLNVFAACYTPIYQALLPDVLPDDKHYTAGLALSQLAMELESLFSPALAALLLLVLSYNALFALNALAFVVAAIVLLLVALPKAKSSERTGGVWTRVSFGMRSYLKTPRLQAALLCNLAISAAGAMVIVNTVIIVQGTLALSEEHVALLMAASGAGSMAAAFMLPRLLEHVSDRFTIVCGAAMCALAMFVSVGQLDYGFLFAPWFLVGVASSMVLIASGRLVRSSCNEQDRNDYFSANFALTHGMWLLCYFLAGATGQWFGMEVSFVVMGCIAAIAGLLALKCWAKHDDALWHEHPEVDHLHPHVHDEHHQHEHEGWEGPEPHVHPHYHAKQRHRHRFVIDEHHMQWPK